MERERCEILVIATVKETCGVELCERNKLNLMESKCLRCLCGSRQ